MGGGGALRSGILGEALSRGIPFLTLPCGSVTGCFIISGHASEEVEWRDTLLPVCSPACLRHEALL